MSIPHLSPVFILRRNPYREHSLLIDLFTLEAGRITCIAKFSKGKGTRSKGMLEPFRLLEASWTGRGEVLTLQQAEEKHRFALKQYSLIQGIYLNEILLRSLWPHQPQPELFKHYQTVLRQLVKQPNAIAVALFELAVLAAAGYVLNLQHDDLTGEDIKAQMRYRFLPEQGLAPDNAQANGVPISGELVQALRQPEMLSLTHYQELRAVLDHLFQWLLKGKPLHARRLLHD